MQALWFQHVHEYWLYPVPTMQCSFGYEVGEEALGSVGWAWQAWALSAWGMQPESHSLGPVPTRSSWGPEVRVAHNVLPIGGLFKDCLKTNYDSPM